MNVLGVCYYPLLYVLTRLLHVVRGLYVDGINIFQRGLRLLFYLVRGLRSPWKA